MIHIAFCDDDSAVLQELCALTEEYRQAHSVELQYTAYQSPLKLLSEIERGARFDVLFLDVLMPGENGIEAASEIRNYDSNVKIIFLTSSDEFAVQSYTVGAYYYQLKPIWADSFFRLMEDVLSACKREASSSLILRCKSGITRIELQQLEYCEVIGKRVFFHMVSGQVWETVGNMEKLSDSLIRHGHFFRAHRSYTVNLDHIVGITGHTVTMSCGAEIPLPRGKYTQIRDAFLARAFQKGWEDNG